MIPPDLSDYFEYKGADTMSQVLFAVVGGLIVSAGVKYFEKRPDGPEDPPSIPGETPPHKNVPLHLVPAPNTKITLKDYPEPGCYYATTNGLAWHPAMAPYGRSPLHCVGNPSAEATARVLPGAQPDDRYNFLVWVSPRPEIKPVHIGPDKWISKANLGCWGYPVLDNGAPHYDKKTKQEIGGYAPRPCKPFVLP